VEPRQLGDHVFATTEETYGVGLFSEDGIQLALDRSGVPRHTPLRVLLAELLPEAAHDDELRADPLGEPGPGPDSAYVTAAARPRNLLRAILTKRSIRQRTDGRGGRRFAKLGLKVLRDDLTLPPDDKAKVRVIQASVASSRLFSQGSR
jgi:hypothetical protein